MIKALLIVVLLLRRVRQLRDRLVSLVLFNLEDFDNAVLLVVWILLLVLVAESCGQYELCVIDAFDCFLEFALRL